MIKRFILAVLLFAVPANAADVIIQYHVWYTGAHTCPTGDPAGVWSHWAWFSEDDNPCNFDGGTSWLRNTSTPAYPLLGPYKSNNAEVMRWHVRLAKAAGINGFICSTFPMLSGDNTTYLNSCLTLLRIAAEEGGFKVGLEFWFPQPGQVSTFYTNGRSNIDSWVGSVDASAVYRVDGLPVVVFPYHGNNQWDTPANLLSNLINQKNAYYMFNGDASVAFLDSIRSSISNSSKIAPIKDYNFPTTSGCGRTSIGGLGTDDVSDALATYAANSYLKAVHAYANFNESAIQNEAGRNPPRYCLNNDGDELGDAIAESNAGTADVFFIDSWNDFFENSMIEPGMDLGALRAFELENIYFGDPYKILKQIAAWKGVTFAEPAIDCATVDAVMLDAPGFPGCDTRGQTVPRAPSSLRVGAVTRTQATSRTQVQ